MADLQTMAGNVRLRLDDPRPQKPSSRRVLQAVIDATQNLYNRLGNSGQAWSIKPDYTLVVTPNTSDYLLAIDSTYGKPIQVLTTFPANPSYVQRLVDFYELGEMYFDWNQPQNIASWLFTDGSNCTAARMAFYYKDDGARWVRVLPQPMLQASYTILFASGNWVESAGLESSPVLSQFHPVVEIWAAQSVLPSCEWWDDQKLNMEHRKELAAALVNDQQRFEDELNRYLRNLVDEHMTIRQSSLDGDAVRGGWY